ncbi:PadR family transcriptional regulator [Actinoallomurus iriomotensis]|uniref:PadR family transcriptional regulator n=1 Tax=Actinoallomurus iriomotensis TaxID=478107 RepID=A0A9W6VKN8_9ACTN|nr:PadR family transcriptional regulator [Actinoallomurus iriomotensis]GLY75488.1 PadR family transcriptional regulator [Actinoallomurus iriomotensis]GLY85099.1 PadR family transcriptional regulator [Actinoallomurus iriomotensis]
MSSPRTPLALAILALLHQEPVHPYEMRRRMRERRLDHALKLRHSSLYTTVQRLQDAGLIEPTETSREGRWPERTVYALTDAGREEFQNWLRELISEPVREYPQFAGAVAFINHVTPDTAVELLKARASALETDIAATEGSLDKLLEMGLPRYLLLDADYLLTIRKAELAWVRSLTESAASGKLSWPLEGTSHDT